IFGSQGGVLPNWTLPGCPTSNGRCHVTTSTRREVQYLPERTPPSIQSVATDSLQNKEKISRAGSQGNKYRMTLGLPVAAVMNCCDN
ncbi:unnamed protein product, partial [Ascophyllum nodosum]